MDKLKIFCVSSSLGKAFSALGHDVAEAHPRPGIYDAASLLPENFKPDLFFQQEVLSPRIILRNLHEIKCIKAFWALDTHLNIHWHKFYGRLFDIFFTPHISFFSNMPKEWHHHNMQRLAMHGYELPFKTYADRTHQASFIGIINEHRQLRKNFVNLLQSKFDLVQRYGMPFGDMLDFYSNSKIIPNESICFEVNFRITEAASAGCCVVSPDIGEDLEALYTPDKEVMIFGDALELMEKMSFLTKKTSLAEKIGHSAWQRTREQHLAINRAVDVICAYKKITPQTMPAKRGNALYYATLAQMARNGNFFVKANQFYKKFLACLEDNDSLWGVYFLYVSTFFSNMHFKEHYEKIRASGRNIGFDGEFAVAAHALKENDLELFNHSMKRLRNDIKPAQSIYEACLILSDLAERCGRNFQPGLNINPGKNPPETSMDILVLAYARNEFDNIIIDKMNRLAGLSKAYYWPRLGWLARKNLNTGDNWRVILQYAVMALHCYRVEEAKEEIYRAYQIARNEGNGENFMRFAGKNYPQLNIAGIIRQP